MSPSDKRPRTGKTASRKTGARKAGAVSVQPEAAPSGKLGTARLLSADVLLYHGTGLISDAIRFFDGTDVSHSSLLLNNAPLLVGEAIARGLIEQPLSGSVSDSAWVMARRLKVRPADVSPVLDRAAFYVAQKERYAYEQILLLAFLCLIRKPKITPIFKRLVIAVLERASKLLLKLTAGGKQPMICSEFVYRCYEEAIPGVLDPFGLSIRRVATPEGIRAGSAPSSGSSPSRESSGIGDGASPRGRTYRCPNRDRHAGQPNIAHPALSARGERAKPRIGACCSRRRARLRSRGVELRGALAAGSRGNRQEGEHRGRRPRVHAGELLSHGCRLRDSGRPAEDREPHDPGHAVTLGRFGRGWVRMIPLWRGGPSFPA